MMDTTYLEYCYADPHFYDQVGAKNERRGPMAQNYRLPGAVDWTSWSSIDAGGWHFVSPTAHQDMPDQGWKIHCSATVENAQRILDAVAVCCGSRDVAFKFLPSPSDLIRSNVKYAPRGSSGKFVTIYPTTNEQTESLLRELDMTIGGEVGPYILSDLRYNEGPLYIRYGAFTSDFVRDDLDDLVPALRRPDGTLEPDLRQPMFSPPAWLDLPPFVRRMQARLGTAERPDEFMYDISEALHFSNGGGIYVANSRVNGRKVVLKEARPHSGLTPEGRDAVTRLTQEARVLEQLREHPNVVTLHSTFEQSGHLFLVEEYVDGRTLNAELVQRNPLIRADETPADRLEYRDWALSLMVEIEGALRSFHAAGIVFGDLHPNNILITPAGRPVFIDFEMSYGINDEDITPTGAPGFVANDGRIGVAADLYALGCTMLSVFLPLTVLIPLDSLKLQHLVDRARIMFDLPENYCRAILQLAGSTHDSPGSVVAATTRSVIEKWSVDSSAGIDEILELIEDGIWESCTLGRKDRAFPGDPRQFTENAVGIAHGACGNLLTTSPDERSLRKTLDWIEDGVAALTQPAFGFYDGIAGIAHTLRHFGRHEAADALVTRLTGIDFRLLPSELYGGLAGIGIFLMEEATRRPASELDAAIETIRALLSARLDEGVTYLTEVDGGHTAATGKAGLMHGATGQALFWICSFERDHDPTDLVRARTALNIDLSACTLVEDGSLQLNEGWRTLPYIGTGSMGVGLVLLRLTAHAPDPHDADTLRSILRCATPAFAIQSNLLNGRAGFLYFVTTIMQSPLAHLVNAGEAHRHAQELGTFAVLRGTGIHFPGEQIIRLSTDWATGSAGVYAALKRYRDVAYPKPETPATALPFIGLDRQLLTAQEEEKK